MGACHKTAVAIQPLKLDPQQSEQLFKILKFDKKLKDSLPIPGIKSRLSSAIVLSFYSRRKKVVTLMLVLSRESRAYIISQEGLPGFLVEKYRGLSELMKNEFKMSDFARLACTDQITCQAELDEL